MTGSPQKKQKYSPGPTCCGACWSAFCKTCVACSSLHSWQLASRTLHSFLRCVSVPKSKICCLFAAGWGVCTNTTWDEFGIYQMEPILKFEVTWGRKIQMGLHNLSHDVCIYITYWNIFFRRKAKVLVHALYRENKEYIQAYHIDSFCCK